MYRSKQAVQKPLCTVGVSGRLAAAGEISVQHRAQCSWSQPPCTISPPGGGISPGKRNPREQVAASGERGDEPRGNQADKARALHSKRRQRPHERRRGRMFSTHVVSAHAKVDAIRRRDEHHIDTAGQLLRPHIVDYPDLVIVMDRECAGAERCLLDCDGKAASRVAPRFETADLYSRILR